VKQQSTPLRHVSQRQVWRDLLTALSSFLVPRRMEKWWTSYRICSAHTFLCRASWKTPWSSWNCTMRFSNTTGCKTSNLETRRLRMACWCCKKNAASSSFACYKHNQVVGLNSMYEANCQIILWQVTGRNKYFLFNSPPSPRTLWQLTIFICLAYFFNPYESLCIGLDFVWPLCLIYQCSAYVQIPES